MLKNGHFHTTGALTLHVARVLLQTTHYALGHSLLYQTVFTACLYDHPLPSNRPGIRALQARFSQFSSFPFLMLNEWRTFARATGAPSLAPGSKFNTTCWTTGPRCREKIAFPRQSAAPQWVILSVIPTSAAAAAAAVYFLKFIVVDCKK